MPASQNHGFVLEHELLTKVYKATASELAAISYTAKNDLPAELNHLDHGVAVSIKCSGNPNRVDMGSALRIWDATTEQSNQSNQSNQSKLHMTVAFYTQNTPTTKTITELVEIDLTGAAPLLFGSLTREQVESLVRAVNAVPQKRRPTAEEHAAMYTLRKSLMGPKAGALQLNIKCDSSQSRLQCSFNNFRAFIAAHPERVVARGTPADFRGATIAETIVSSRRARSPKA